jgi:GDPmannose 4,6-dehydratase
LLADSRKARQQLGWEPRVTFKELVAIMVDADMEAAGVQPPGQGKRILEARLGHWHQWRNSVTKAVQSVTGRASE